MYEIKRKCNQDIISNTELIITNSNVNDIHINHFQKSEFSLDMVYRDAFWLYQELYFLNKKVLVILLPYEIGDFRIINNIHRSFCQKFGFNVIDMQKYYENKALNPFDFTFDGVHQFYFITQELAKNIIQNMDKFYLPKRLHIKNNNPEFKICTPKEMKVQGLLQENHLKNSKCDELCYKFYDTTKLEFGEQFKDYYLIAVHTWNDHSNGLVYCDLEIRNASVIIDKECGFRNFVFSFFNAIKIDDQTVLSLSKNQHTKIKEHCMGISSNEKAVRLNECNLITFFLASFDGLSKMQKISFEKFIDEEFIISKEYDFDFLIPSVDFYARIIDTYMKTKEFRNKNLSIKNKQDYIKALKTTHTLIEWLGIALIYSKRIWYKGGFIWIWFEAKRLKRKFKKSSQ